MAAISPSLSKAAREGRQLQEEVRVPGVDGAPGQYELLAGSRGKSSGANWSSK